MICSSHRVVLYCRKNNQPYKSTLDSLVAGDYRAKVAALVNPRLHRQMDALHLSLSQGTADILLLNSLTSGSQ